jgi:hypothetical protein
LEKHIFSIFSPEDTHNANQEIFPPRHLNENSIWELKMNRNTGSKEIRIHKTEKYSNIKVNET